MSNNKIQTLKGFRDFLPEDAIKRNYLRGKILIDQKTRKYVFSDQNFGTKNQINGIKNSQP